MRRALILLCLLALVGCGDAVTDRETVDDETNAITAAAERTLEQHSARISVEGTAEANGGALPFAGTGLVDFDTGAARTDVPAEVAGMEHPGEYVRALARAGGVTTSGTEPIDGRRTIHYAGEQDGAPVDVWVDDSGVVRRLRVTYDVKATDQRPAQTVDATIAFEEFGVDTDAIQPR